MFKISRLARLLAGLLVALAFCLPLYWVVVASLRQTGLPPPRTIEWWPADPQWDNYRHIFQLVPMSRYALNSLLVVAAAVPLTLLTASLAGFGLAQLPERPRRQLLSASVAVLVIPAASVWLFRFQILRALGLIDSLAALVVPALSASSPLFVLLFYWGFRRIPPELFEAARLDAASALTVWWRVALPLARPTTTGVTILTFVLYWSDFVSPVLYIYNPRYYTLPVGLQILNQLDSTNWPLLMAAAVFITLPILALFAILQRLFLHPTSLANLMDKN
jgi:multiple sugar transport system permease protein